MTSRTHRYCAVCDYWYRKGTWKEHKAGSQHQVNLEERRKMELWYKGNGR